MSPVLRRPFLTVFTVIAIIAAGVPSIAGDDVIELVPDTAILLDQSSGSGGGGNSTSTSSTTNIFSPAAFVDYKRFGGEPTAVVDRYPFASAAQCAPNPAPCFKDTVYVSAPQGFVEPRYSTFYKSTDLGQTFRVPFRTPFTAKPAGTGQGGGDSHLVVGSLSHKIYFVDLALDHITMNVSSDEGENWTTDDVLGAGLNLLDDRQWVDADETFPDTMASGGSVYISAINLLDVAFPTLIAARSTHGAASGTFVTDSTCLPATFEVGAGGLVPGPDATPTPCPDPSDPYLWVAGPVAADKAGTATRPASHAVYIPFVRRVSTAGAGLDITNWQLYIAKSTDGGASWTRHLAHDFGRPDVRPDNIFVQLAIDRGGNLYYTWSQSIAGGEQDVYYTFSTNGGTGWVSPINLTGGKNDSAIFPWMVAGDPGRVDLVYYKANNGDNSNVARQTTVWNVFFAQSMKALNTGANFNGVQVSAEPNHLGIICTGGVGCDEDRDLLDFITVDVDHLGAAHIVYSDDHQARNSDTRDKLTRQLSGNSIFKDQNITLLSSWPIRDHAVADRAGDVFDGAGTAKGSCPGMDILGANSSRTSDLLTVTLALNSPPSGASAVACATAGATGGLWGAEFWSASSEGGTEGGNTFYLAYRDNSPDGAPGVEAGVVDNLNLTITSLEFRPTDVGTPATPGGTCFGSTPPSPCTLTISVRLTDLGISSGNGLYGLTGLSTYFFGTTERPPLLRIEGGNSEQADATAPIHYLGSGTP
jgi:hypothetical protein